MNQSELVKIKSFQVDHDILKPGIYVSRCDGDIITYDIRVKQPNNNENDYLTPAIAHTVEHVLATYLRSTLSKDNIVYFGPMGCQTGFYMITRGITHKRAIELIKSGFEFLKNYEGLIPGSSRKECGNFKLHNRYGAKQLASQYLQVIHGWTVDDLHYPKAKE